MKDSFILYNSFYEPIKSLKNEQLGKLLRAIFDYTINGVITQDNDIIVAFMFIKNQIDLDTKKWEEEKAKRSEAGKKGMKNRWHNKNNSVITKDNKDNNVINAITNITDNVNVNENVNVNDNDTTISSIYDYLENIFGRSLYEPEYEIVETWEDNDLTRYAINQGILNGKFNIKYIDKILFSYKKNNITTVQQAQMAEEEFNKNKNKPKEQLPEWFNQDIKKQKNENEEELKNMLKEFE